MPLLTLWTVRPKSDYVILQQQGVYRTNEQLVATHRLEAYHWMAEKLQRKVPAPEYIQLPVWAWYRAHGLTRVKPNLRRKGHLQSGEQGVRIEFEVPKHLVLLSNFDTWHAVLNNHCLALSDAEYRSFEELESKHPTIPYCGCQI